MIMQYVPPEHTAQKSAMVFVPHMMVAVYNWILETEQTPRVIASMAFPDVVVPEYTISKKTGAITSINLNPEYIKDLLVTQDVLTFTIFEEGTDDFHVSIPTNAIMHIKAHESYQGVAFNNFDGKNVITPTKPKLHVVK